MAKKYTEEDLLMMTEEKVTLKHFFGEMDIDDVTRWYDLQAEADDYLITNFAKSMWI